MGSTIISHVFLDPEYWYGPKNQTHFLLISQARITDLANLAAVFVENNQ